MKLADGKTSWSDVVIAASPFLSFACLLYAHTLASFIVGSQWKLSLRKKQTRVEASSKVKGIFLRNIAPRWVLIGTLVVLCNGALLPIVPPLVVENSVLTGVCYICHFMLSALLASVAANRAQLQHRESLSYNSSAEYFLHRHGPFGGGLLVGVSMLCIAFLMLWQYSFIHIVAVLSGTSPEGSVGILAVFTCIAGFQGYVPGSMGGDCVQLVMVLAGSIMTFIFSAAKHGIQLNPEFRHISLVKAPQHAVRVNLSLLLSSPAFMFSEPLWQRSWSAQTPQHAVQAACFAVGLSLLLAGMYCLTSTFSIWPLNDADVLPAILSMQYEVELAPYVDHGWQAVVLFVCCMSLAKSTIEALCVGLKGLLQFGILKHQPMHTSSCIVCVSSAGAALVVCMQWEWQTAHAVFVLLAESCVVGVLVGCFDADARYMMGHEVLYSTTLAAGVVCLNYSFNSRMGASTHDRRAPSTSHLGYHLLSWGYQLLVYGASVLGLLLPLAFSRGVLHLRTEYKKRSVFNLRRQRLQACLPVDVDKNLVRYLETELDVVSPHFDLTTLFALTGDLPDHTNYADLCAELDLLAQWDVNERPKHPLCDDVQPDSEATLWSLVNRVLSRKVMEYHKPDCIPELSESASSDEGLQVVLSPEGMFSLPAARNASCASNSPRGMQTAAAPYGNSMLTDTDGSSSSRRAGDSGSSSSSSSSSRGGTGGAGGSSSSSRHTGGAGKASPTRLVRKVLSAAGSWLSMSMPLPPFSLLRKWTGSSRKDLTIDTQHLDDTNRGPSTGCRYLAGDLQLSHMAHSHTASSPNPKGWSVDAAPPLSQPWNNPNSHFSSSARATLQATISSIAVQLQMGDIQLGSDDDPSEITPLCDDYNLTEQELMQSRTLQHLLTTRAQSATELSTTRRPSPHTAPASLMNTRSITHEAALQAAILAARLQQRAQQQNMQACAQMTAPAATLLSTGHAHDSIVHRSASDSLPHMSQRHSQGDGTDRPDGRSKSYQAGMQESARLRAAVAVALVGLRVQQSGRDPVHLMSGRDALVDSAELRPDSRSLSASALQSTRGYSRNLSISGLETASGQSRNLSISRLEAASGYSHTPSASMVPATSTSSRTSSVSMVPTTGGYSRNPSASMVPTTGVYSRSLSASRLHAAGGNSRTPSASLVRSSAGDLTNRSLSRLSMLLASHLRVSVPQAAEWSDSLSDVLRNDPGGLQKQECADVHGSTASSPEFAPHYADVHGSSPSSPKFAPQYADVQASTAGSHKLAPQHAIGMMTSRDVPGENTPESSPLPSPTSLHVNQASPYSHSPIASRTGCLELIITPTPSQQPTPALSSQLLTCTSRTPGAQESGPSPTPTPTTTQATDLIHIKMPVGIATPASEIWPTSTSDTMSAAGQLHPHATSDVGIPEPSICSTPTAPITPLLRPSQVHLPAIMQPEVDPSESGLWHHAPVHTIHTNWIQASLDGLCSDKSTSAGTHAPPPGMPQAQTQTLDEGPFFDVFPPKSTHNQAQVMPPAQLHVIGICPDASSRQGTRNQAHVMQQAQTHVNGLGPDVCPPGGTHNQAPSMPQHQDQTHPHLNIHTLSSAPLQCATSTLATPAFTGLQHGPHTTSSVDTVVASHAASSSAPESTVLCDANAHDVLPAHDCLLTAAVSTCLPAGQRADISPCLPAGQPADASTCLPAGQRADVSPCLSAGQCADASTCLPAGQAKIRLPGWPSPPMLPTHYTLLIGCEHPTDDDGLCLSLPPVLEVANRQCTPSTMQALSRQTGTSSSARPLGTVRSNRRATVDTELSAASPHTSLQEPHTVSSTALFAGLPVSSSAGSRTVSSTALPAALQVPSAGHLPSLPPDPCHLLPGSPGLRTSAADLSLSSDSVPSTGNAIGSKPQLWSTIAADARIEREELPSSSLPHSRNVRDWSSFSNPIAAQLDTLPRCTSDKSSNRMNSAELARHDRQSLWQLSRSAFWSSNHIFDDPRGDDCSADM